MDLRLARPEDLDAIRAIVDAAYAPYVPVIGRRPGPMDDDYAALVAAGRVQVAGTGSPEAVLVLLPEADHLLLDNIAVAPGAQGKGLGRKLVEAAAGQARAAGYDELRLYTHEKMEANIALYTRLDFVETHRAVDKGFPRVYMTRRLA